MENLSAVEIVVAIVVGLLLLVIGRYSKEPWDRFDEWVKATRAGRSIDAANNEIERLTNLIDRTSKLREHLTSTVISFVEPFASVLIGTAMVAVVTMVMLVMFDTPSPNTGDAESFEQIKRSWAASFSLIAVPLLIYAGWATTRMLEIIIVARRLSNYDSWVEDINARIRDLQERIRELESQ